MFEFFSVVDATHDDPSLYPTLSEANSAHPFRWEESDGNQPQVFTTKSVAVWQRSETGWSATRRIDKVTFTVVVTQARVVVYCEKFTKGGGWFGFGAGGLAFAVVANVVSHARAAARRRGKVLVGQIRYDWLTRVGIASDARNRPIGLWLAVDAGSLDEPRELALELRLSARARPGAWATAIGGAACRRRLSQAELTEPQRLELEQSASRASFNSADVLPGSIRVGSRPMNAHDRATVSLVSAQRSAVPQSSGPDSAASADVGCPACGATSMVGAASCGRCGAVLPLIAIGTRSSSDVQRANTEATTRRSALQANTIADQQPFSVAAPATEPGRLDESQQTHAAHQRPESASALSRGPASAPPEVWGVAIGLAVLGVLSLYPAAHLLFLASPHLFDGDEFGRAFAALFVQAALDVGASGAALILLAVGLIRGSRVSQLLTCVLAGLVAFADLVQLQRPVYAVLDSSSGVVVASVAIAMIVIAVLVGSPNSRVFFSADPRPAGVIATSVISIFTGGVTVLSGALLLVAETLAQRYLWYGLVLVGVGIGLIVAGRALRRVRPAALSVTVLSYAAFVIAMLLIGWKLGELSMPSTLLPVGLCIAGLVAVTVPRTSRAYFVTQGRHLPIDGLLSSSGRPA